MLPQVHTPEPIVYQPPAAAPVVLPAAQHLTVAYAPDGQGGMIAHYVPVQALTAQHFAPAAMHAVPDPVVVRTGMDPVAQRLAGFGVAAAGAGFGIGEVVSALAGAGSAVLVLAALAAAWKILPSGGRTVVNHTTETHHHTVATGMFGRARSRIDHNRVGQIGGQ